MESKTGRLGLIIALIVGYFTMVNRNAARVEGYSGPREFETVAQAQAWVDAHRLPLVLIAGADGSVNFNKPVTNQLYDCDDYATDFENAALKEGWKITQVPVTDGKIWGVPVTGLKAYHVGNWTKIAGVYYYIESSPAPDNWKLRRILAADSPEPGAPPAPPADYSESSNSP